MTVEFSGKKAYGPASTFKSYLDSIGRSIDIQGNLFCCGFATCNLARDPISSIIRCVNSAWPQVAVANIDRKGVGHFLPHPMINKKNLSAFNDRDQKLLAFFFLGAFQTEAIKNKWKKDQLPLSCVHFARGSTRDLIGFGMCPVSTYSAAISGCCEHASEYPP